MKTSVDAVSGVERKITVEIPADEVDRRIEQEFTELRRMVPVRGFRKGKAPMEMVKRMFRDSVEAEVSEHLVKESLTEVVKEKDLKVLSLPARGGRQGRPGEGFRLLRHRRGRPGGRAGRLQGDPRDEGEGERDRRGRRGGDRAASESFAQFHARGRARRPESDLVEFGFTATVGRRNGRSATTTCRRALQRHPVRRGVRAEDARGRTGDDPRLRDRLSRGLPGTRSTRARPWRSR